MNGRYDIGPKGNFVEVHGVRRSQGQDNSPRGPLEMISMSSLPRSAPTEWREPPPIGAPDPGASRASRFHDYALEVSAPDINLMLTRPSRGTWRAPRHQIGRIVLQTRTTGGATICAGTSPSGIFEFLLPGVDDPHPLMVNGSAVARHAIAILPPGRPFALACKGPYRSTSLFMPQEVLREAGFSWARLHQLAARPAMIRPPRAAARRLALIAAEACGPSQPNAVPLRADRLGALERDLLSGLRAAVDGSASLVHATSHRSSLDRINRQALALIHGRNGPDLSVQSLVRRIDVADRTLHRAFYRFFGIGPTRYMKLLRLNRVHHQLQTCKPESATVTSVMTFCGVTEFGRFAGAYRALFGETPSATLKRRLAAERSATSMRLHTEEDGLLQTVATLPRDSCGHTVLG